MVIWKLLQIWDISMKMAYKMNKQEERSWSLIIKKHIVITKEQQKRISQEH